MDTLPNEPVGGTPTPTPAPVLAPVPSEAPVANGRWMMLASTAALVLVGAGAAFAYTVYKPAPQGGALQVATTTAQTAAGWKLYENYELGIAFEYPQAWGEIGIMHDELGCDVVGTASVWGQASSTQLVADMAATEDPCDQAMLSLMGRGSILAATTPLYHKYPYGRGGFWGDKYVADDMVLANFCTAEQNDRSCELIQNKNGVTIAKAFGPYGEESSDAWVYVMRSPHPYYSSIVLSSYNLESGQQADFDRMVDSLTFITD